MVSYFYRYRGSLYGILTAIFHLAFIVIGQVALQVKSNMNPYLDAILFCIKEALSVKG